MRVCVLAFVALSCVVTVLGCGDENALLLSNFTVCEADREARVTVVCRVQYGALLQKMGFGLQLAQISQSGGPR